MYALVGEGSPTTIQSKSEIQKGGRTVFGGPRLRLPASQHRCWCTVAGVLNRGGGDPLTVRLMVTFTESGIATASHGHNPPYIQPHSQFASWLPSCINLWLGSTPALTLTMRGSNPEKIRILLNLILTLILAPTRVRSLDRSLKIKSTPTPNPTPVAVLVWAFKTEKVSDEEVW